MKALLVVDMQVECFAGTPPRLDEAGTVRRINTLAARIRPTGLVVFIQHTDTGAYAHGSQGWRLLPELDVRSEDVLVEKSACDSFLETSLDAELRARNVSELIIVGCATDFCVDTTVRAAASHGYRVVVPSDGHTTRDRPHLSAQGVIAHHNYVWADLILPRGATVRVLPVSRVMDELSPT